jgi:hypothetical protein
MEPEKEHEEKMDAWMAEMKDKQKETVVCQEATEANPEKMKSHPGRKEADSAELEFVAMHREAAMEDAVVKPVAGRKKWHKGRHLAVGRRGKPKELTQGDCGSRGKLASGCRKVSRRAALAWSKRNFSRNIRTEGNCGPRQELGAAGIRMTLRAKVARRKKHGLQRKGKYDIAPRTPKGCTCRMKLWKDSE